METGRKEEETGQDNEYKTDINTNTSIKQIQSILINTDTNTNTSICLKTNRDCSYASVSVSKPDETSNLNKLARIKFYDHH